MAERNVAGCRNCHYARTMQTDPRRLDAPRILQCRFAPPRTFPVMAQGLARDAQLGTFTAAWPSVQPQDWCGQHQPGDVHDVGGN